MTSIPRAIFTHSSSSIPFCTYAVLDASRLIRMYCKCGSVKNACRVFDQMSDKNIASWHLMLGGYTSNGLRCDGLLVFQQMKQSGVSSDGETFELVLTACA
ncbi:hypothetical protein JHK87_006203 [Glycine soja]|nr:hypothetical protein JHK87_006203 [Glycine soja]